VLEFAGIGPGPFCGMLLSDLGADVVRIDRKGSAVGGLPTNVTSRGRRSVALDLKSPAAVEACLKLAERADALVEGYRPGVMERLGLGPDVVLPRSPGLVYGRMTGWGQTGPYAPTAGHDLNYIAVTGALHAIGPAGKPTAPLNLVGDYGGGALYMAFGLLAGIIGARETGRGQVVDCAMADGAASLMSMFYGLLAAGTWADRRGANILDGAAPYYDTYVCADGEWISIACVEPQFYAVLIEKLGLAASDLPEQNDRAGWPRLKAAIAGAVVARTRQDWCEILGGTDACFAPVLSMTEALQDPHNRARGTFVEVGGVLQPAPAPRFLSTPGAIQGPPPKIGADTRPALVDWGFTEADLAALETAGAIAVSAPAVA
jgi:alpha-methylacyl-CoA racemase